MANKFESQNETIIELLMTNCQMTRENAMKLWFNSKTYAEIIRRKLTYTSATRAYSELELEYKNDPDWMQNPFDL